MKQLFALVLLALLVGCATAPPAPEQPARPLPETPLPQASTAQRADALPGAVHALVRDAEAASQAGDHARAAALLERALNIAPRHPVLWQNLAVVRYREGNYPQAEALALKSNALAGEQRELRRRNWELIAAARRLAGDAAGAATARTEAAKLGRAPR